MLSRFFAALALTGAITPVLADVIPDGLYCAGTGYIAMEFATTKARAPHILKIARFDAKRGPRWAGEVVLEPFQTRHMVCTDDRVTLYGTAAARSITVAVQLSATFKPTLAAAGTAAPARDDMPPPVTLGDWADPDTVQLTALPVAGAKPGRRFQLQITRVSRQLLPAGHKHQVRSVLQELDAAGHAKRSLLLHKGTRIEAGV